MGVPKFYRWISERYPCLSQVVKDYQIPEFDNFYLDMNGIIHSCSHPNDDDPTFRISEDKIFNDIFRYIEALFRIIKPQKVMFLAVDGVAPRAKMNQQRGRRFRSAREAQDLVRKALLRGEILPSEPRFDSNCITPGTDFMARLHQHLMYFINKKLSSDPTWQKVEIILSGHDVPGEGEHKIMDYIRYKKAQPDYDSNTRHCLYGLDADLIMLGLVSHEPHFSLLREEVRFGKKSQKRQTTPDTITFHLLHLSVMREYLDFEFASVKDKLPFGYDLERIIDDWVLMGFLVGNDFLPHLPNMHIRQEVLPTLYNKYKEVLPTLDGYINEGGTLHMGRFEAYLRALDDFDYSFHEELQGGLKWLAGKRQQGRETARKTKKTHKGGGGSGEETSSPDENGATGASDSDLLGSEEGGVFPTGLADFMSNDVGGASEEFDESSEAAVKLKRDLKIDNLQSFFDAEDETTVDNFEQDFFDHKSTYYQSKLGIDHVNEAVLLEQAKCYVVGIQWVLHYYYSGVPSWSWFYPYHYAPYVSDIKGFSDIRIDFQSGHPFFPFEQLLAVLPPASKSLLPKAYQPLMVNEDSPVRDFYPLDFETDLNGKQMEWEAVVLIPFIDEGRLLEAMKPCSIYLSDEEVRRNGFGKCLVYGFDANAEKAVYPSPWPQFFKDVTNCQVKLVQLPHFPFPVESSRFVRGLCDGVKLDVHFPGFPSLKHVPHSGRLEKRGVRVFQVASRGDNLILLVPPREIPENLQKLAADLIGQIVYVGWPYLTEALVHSLSDGKVQYYQSNQGNGKPHKSRAPIESSDLSPGESKQWVEEESLISRQHLDRRGIDIGQVELIVYAQTLQGKRYIVDKRKDKGSVCLHKEWATIAEPFPYQTMVRDITAFAPEFREKVNTLEELFPPKSYCFILATPHYGSLAEVVSVEMANLRVVVKVTVHPEPDMDSVINNYKLAVRYLPSFVVSEKVGLPGIVLSRITSNIQVEKGSKDNKKEREKAKVGLSWKFAWRNQEILGYARKTERGWSYSPDAVDILRQFKLKFPVMFDYLVKNPQDDSYYEQDLFPNPDGDESLPAVRDWLKQLPSQGLEAVECGSYTLDPPQITAVEKAVLDVQRRAASKPPRATKLKVKPACLFKPVDHQGNLIPDPEAEYYLFDRVINVSTTNAVPFGLRGTVMGIYGEGSNEMTYEILFDEEFLGGLALRCSGNRAYHLPPSCLLNISHGNRLEEEKKAQKLTGHTPRGDYTRTDFSYASATSKPHPQSADSGPTPHSHAFFRSKYRFSSSSTSWLTDQSTPPQGRDAVDSYSHYYDHCHGNQRSGSTPHTYGQRSMALVTEGSRDAPRFSRGRGGGSGHSSDGRGRTQHREESREQKHSLTDKRTPVIMQRRGGEGTAAAGGGTKPSAKQQASKQTQSVDKKAAVEREEDAFSAALQALPKMTSSSIGSPGSAGKNAKHGEGEPKEKEKRDAKKKSPQSGKERDGQRSPKKDKKRDLSPSVAAIFDAVGSGQASSSDVVSDDTDAPEEAGPSAALLSMLSGHSAAPPPHSSAHPMPPALQKLMRAPAPAMTGPRHPANDMGFPPQPPRVPLLPYPGYQQHPPPQLPLGGIPPQVRYPMPFGPPAAVNHVTQLHQVAQSAGHPKPEITVENTPQGCIGVVAVGTYKFKGLPCPNPEDAKQSAAAIAISNLPGAKMPLLPYPMYHPGPYSYPMMQYPPMFPPPHGPRGFNAPPTGPRYHTPGQRPATPPQSTRLSSPSFVPLQVQRRQVHKTTGKETDSTKSTERSPVGAAPKTKEAKHTLLEDQLKQMSLEDVSTKEQPSSQTSTSEKGHEPRDTDSLGTLSTIEGAVDQKTTTKVEEEKDTPASQNGDDASIKAAETEEQLLKRLEHVQHDSEETKEKLKKITGYVRAFEATPREIPPDHEGIPPHPESQTDHVDVSELVSDVDVLASVQDREEREMVSLLEAVEAMEPVQASETDPRDVHVVGEIVGPGLMLGGEQGPGTAESALLIEHGTSVVLGESTIEEESGESALKTEHAQEAEDKVVMTTDGSANLPSSSHTHTPSKKQKRQLAASFMNT